MVVRSVFLLLLMCVVCSSWAAQDPTAPLGWVSESASPVNKIESYPLPRLQSIVCQQTIPCVAVLNDQVVGIGESLFGYTVEAIEPQQVTLSRRGKTWDLGLFSLDIKQ
ncbi:MSHA biogenesis protein MshK [Vibrio anguillarum]|uniref:MSHA biogenesis protein MshK n=1 Tax=Vibrio anguillarum TaxID=55601 RepID=UPI00097E21BF|nr:MSHA biogenesis protein MshK [Vibrio anguillarum]MBF4281556.1 MSHA biogenesis protein MshK [Vibrio anguillarum]MBF4287569.1 MSHA biogenesis protein MshK [Vibrio anguillarum]MBF4339584.1 MSHA biogenesis protein MshK [Vibrio anguillarum]MBF4356207.1 MSHA biogenesis protein MshK [Vibrio anguillarum]MBF4378645.1 MSHA biogenesis protein MshK [Vibrio anguillarum]